MTKKIILSDLLAHILESLSVISPEVFLGAVFLLLIIIELILYKYIFQQSDSLENSIAQSYQNTLWGISLISVLIALNQIISQYSTTNDTFLFGEMLILDSKAIFFKIITTFSVIILLAHIYVSKRKYDGEFYPLVISILIGLNLMAMSVNLLMIYLSIEIVSISSYVLTTFNKTKKASEGGLKYIIFGAASSAIMLYGMSLLYGMTGTLSIASPDFSRGIAQTDNVASTIAIVLTLSGFLFKISATPFHIWTPDVYQSAPTPIVAFFAVAPKIASFLVIIRFYSVIPTDLTLITAIIALASITFGNFSALWQKDAKRLLAYSTIAHTGFMLIGLVMISELGIKSIVFYLIVSLFTNFSAFLLIDYAANNTQGQKSDNDSKFMIENFKGLGRLNPLFGILILIVMISLAGLPPTGGFIAKLNIFSALWEAYQASGKQLLLLLFIFGLLNTVISLSFYLKIPFLMFFKESEKGVTFKLSLEQAVLAILLVFPILALFFNADWLMNIINSL
ncbi:MULTISPECIES: NADH-quinone oxidoreductase subunit N [unclassified Arcicella]|uniref:NADH-quinone oxidoreductase subunit N n=1 Tax=unclassified Arcicella TaxID=2644986 RepID=UPI0028636FB4|nr:MULTISPECIES: NADH-quinone oxidoreductase subunit N [unclassified Arcicella]MDR6560577.1 NADH-quinone oxidoreductase subunit N [Arcicella sp. BE51]MDR6814660.1 NADH-quinone oxidoreductase subunit N [Arcicella sp. BE140]MDR6826106.1 NADH-quinone oxidoreductase subunit N [Arcicella sp. BE139]